MDMRMRELSEASGLSKTTIHHYIREGLLPPSRKSAHNAALYGTEHLERLRLVSRWRSRAAGELSIPQVRIALRHVEQGTQPEQGARLALSGIEAASRTAPSLASLAGLAEAAGVDAGFVESLSTAGLVGNPDGGFSAGDVPVILACRDLCRDLDVDAADLVPLAELLREVGEYARSLSELHETRALVESDRPEERVAGLRTGIRSLLEALLWRSLET